MSIIAVDQRYLEDFKKYYEMAIKKLFRNDSWKSAEIKISCLQNALHSVY